MADIGIQERADLQSWVEANPEMVGPDLLVITTEFDQWELAQQKVADRLDVLFLDSDGRLLVAELKRGEAPDITDLQALKYAAYCSTLTTADVCDEYARYHEVSSEGARESVIGHAPALEEDEPGSMRVRLLAARFGPAVTSVVLWLNETGVDIGCIEVRVRKVSETTATLTARQTLPPPEAADYLVRRRRREAVEEQKAASTRRRNSVTVLIEHEAIEPGTVLTLSLDAFGEEYRARIENEIEKDARYAKAVWTGEGLRKALRWEFDGGSYSASGLVWTILDRLGFSPGSVPGPVFWLLPNGRSLYDESVYVTDGSAATDAASLSLPEAAPAEPAPAGNGQAIPAV